MRATKTTDPLQAELLDVDAMTTEERLETGKLLGEVIEARGVNRSRLAAAASVDRNTLRTLERGERAPHPGVLKRVINALGLSANGNFEAKFSSYPAEMQLFLANVAELFEQLPDSARDDARADVLTILGGKVTRANRGHHTDPASDRETKHAADLARMVKYLG